MISDRCDMGKHPENHIFCRGFIPMGDKTYWCSCKCHSAARGDGESNGCMRWW